MYLTSSKQSFRNKSEKIRHKIKQANNIVFSCSLIIILTLFPHGIRAIIPSLISNQASICVHHSKLSEIPFWIWFYLHQKGPFFISFQILIPFQKEPLHNKILARPPLVFCNLWHLWHQIWSSQVNITFHALKQIFSIDFSAKYKNKGTLIVPQ